MPPKLAVGARVQFGANANWSDGDSGPAPDARFSVNGASGAITATGRFTALRVGTVRVVAQLAGLRASIIVTIVDTSARVTSTLDSAQLRVTMPMSWRRDSTVRVAATILRGGRFPGPAPSAALRDTTTSSPTLAGDTASVCIDLDPAKFRLGTDSRICQVRSLEIGDPSPAAGWAITPLVAGSQSFAIHYASWLAKGPQRTQRDTTFVVTVADNESSTCSVLCVLGNLKLWLLGAAAVLAALVGLVTNWKTLRGMVAGIGRHGSDPGKPQ